MKSLFSHCLPGKKWALQRTPSPFVLLGLPQSTCKPLLASTLNSWPTGTVLSKLLPSIDYTGKYGFPAN